MMKTTIRFVGVAVLSAAIGSAAAYAWAQRPRPADGQMPSESPTKFERFVLKRGEVLVREFYDLGSGGSAKWTVIRAYAPGETDYAIGLSVRISPDVGGRYEPRSGLLDADEVLSLHAAFPKMRTMLRGLDAQKEPPTTEVEFKGSRVSVGFTRSREFQSFFIRVGSLDRDIVFVNNASDLGEFIEKAAKKVQELRSLP